MKKFVAILASVVIAAFSTLSAFAADTVNSPTAPVIPTTVPATTAPAGNGSSTSPQTSDNIALVGLGVLLAAAAGTVAVKKLAK